MGGFTKLTNLKFRVRQLGPSRCTYLTCQKEIQGIHVKEEERTVWTVNNIIFSQKLTNWTVFENFSGSGSTRKKPKNGLSSYPKNRKKHLKSDFFQIRWPLPISTLFSLDIPVHTGPGGAEGTSEPGQLCRLGLRLAAATWPYSILFLARLQKKLVLIL